MFIALIVVSVVLAALLVASAVLKLSHRPDVVSRYARVGVRETQLNALAGVLITGTIGILTGIAWPLVGVAAAGGLVVYFALAVVAHVRADDLANVMTPAVLEVLSIIALGLRLASIER